MMMTTAIRRPAPPRETTDSVGLSYRVACLVALFAWALVVGMADGQAMLESWSLGGPGTRHAVEAWMGQQMIAQTGSVLR